MQETGEMEQGRVGRVAKCRGKNWCLGSLRGGRADFVRGPLKISFHSLAYIRDTLER